MSHEVEEFHQQGSLSIENRDEVIEVLQLAHKVEGTVDVGLQVSAEGRIWLCVNGTAFIRFKPATTQAFVGS